MHTGRTLRDVTLAELAGYRWVVDARAPIIHPPWPSPIVADPTFLPPSDTPDGRWHLWAHSLFGVHHWTSSDGLEWRRRRTVARNALRPHIVRIGTDGNARGAYRLTVERTRLMLPIGLPWSSWIESRGSEDLHQWSPPETLLAPTLPWHDAGRLGRSVSNPCLVRNDDAAPESRWRLYYSAGLTLLRDCGFPEPTYIGVATAPTADGPFAPEADPLLGPDTDDATANLAAGAIKVLRVADGWAGFQNAISWNGRTGRSRSALRLLGSPDGFAWRVLAPVLAPTGDGWMADFVYANDVRDTPAGPRLWFNARRGRHWLHGTERLGFADISP